MRKSLILIFLLFGISSAADTGWLVGDSCNIANNATNCDSTYALDGKYGAWLDIGVTGGGTIFQHHFNADIPAGATVDSFYIAADSTYVSLSDLFEISIGYINNGGEYGQLISSGAFGTNSKANYSFKIDTTYTGSDEAFVNSDTFAIAITCGTGDDADQNAYVDMIKVKVFYTPAVACTLTIDSVTVTQLSHAKAKFQIDGHCGWDSVWIKYDTSTSYGSVAKTITTDTTFTDTLTGLWLDDWYYRVIVWDGATADTTTGTWTQAWMVDTVMGIASTWIINSGAEWFTDLEVMRANIANFDTMIAWYSLNGYTDSTNKMVQTTADILSDNFLTIATPDTIYMSAKFVRNVGGDRLISPRKDTFFVATYQPDSVTSFTLDTTGTGWRQAMIPDTVQIQFTTSSITWPESVAYYFLMGADTLSDSLAINNRHVVAWQASHTFTIKDTVRLIQPDTLRVYLQIRDNIQGDGSWSTRQLRKIYWGGTSNAPPTACRVTTFRTEQISPNSDGCENPNLLSPKQLVTWTPKFSVMNNLTAACSLYIDVGVAPGGATMWSYHTFLSDTLAVGERTAKITYAGSTLQDGVTYYWRARTKSVTEASGWSADNTFEGVDPAWWVNSGCDTSVYHCNIRFGNDHTFLPANYMHSVPVNRGYTSKIASNGLPNESVVDMQMVYIGGWLYFAWSGITNSSSFGGTATQENGRFFIRGYNYTTDTWSQPETVMAVKSEVHYYPILTISPDSFLYLTLPGHGEQVFFVKSDSAFKTGTGFNLSKWTGGIAVVDSSKTGIIADISKNWEHNSMQGWAVSACSLSGTKIFSNIKVDSNTATKIYFSGGYSVVAGGRYQVVKQVDILSSYVVPTWVGNNYYMFYRGNDSTAGQFGIYSYIKSTDKGQTWGTHRTIATYFEEFDMSMYCSPYNTGESNDSAVHLEICWWTGYQNTDQGGRAISYIHSKMDASGDFTDWYDVSGNFVGQSLPNNRMYHHNFNSSLFRYDYIKFVSGDTIADTAVSPTSLNYVPHALIGQRLFIRHSGVWVEYKITDNAQRKIWVAGGYSPTPSYLDMYYVCDTMAITYQNCPKVMTCDNPFAFSGYTDSTKPAGNDVLAAENECKVNVIQGKPILDIQTFDLDSISTGVNNLSPCDLMVAKWYSVHSEWLIDNLSGVSKFQARDYGVDTAYSVVISNGTTSGIKIILNNGAGIADTFDNVTTSAIMREAINHGYAGINNGDSCTFVRIQYAGIDLPANMTLTKFLGGNYRTYSYREARASKVYKLYNFRNGGTKTVEGNDCYVFGFVLPDSQTYFAGELYYWRGVGMDTASIPVWSKTALSAGSEYGIGRPYALPKAYSGIDKAICFSRNSDVLVSTDFQFSHSSPTGDDFRVIVTDKTSGATQRHRLATYWDAETTQVYFRVGPTALPANQNYYTNKVVQLYWKNNNPGTVKNNPDSVFDFLESFESGFGNNKKASGVHGFTASDTANYRTFLYYDYNYLNWTGPLRSGKYYLECMNSYSTSMSKIYKTTYLKNTEITAQIRFGATNEYATLVIVDDSSHYLYVGGHMGSTAKGTYGWSSAAIETPSWTDTIQIGFGAVGTIPNFFDVKIQTYTIGDSTSIWGYVNNQLMFTTKRRHTFDGITKIGYFGVGGVSWVDHIKAVSFVPSAPDYNITPWVMRKNPGRREIIFRREDY